ncbi:MAG: helix-turn-helix domain-containing protein [Solirubrobacterales bacterium]
MIERGLTARDLAQLAGLNEQTVGAARHGHAIAVHTLRRICQALDGSPIIFDPSTSDSLAQSRRAIQASTREVGE